MPVNFISKQTVLQSEGRKGEIVYTPKLITFGKKTTEDAAKQISEESSFTEADVIGVLNRYKRYVIERLKDGYCVELLGFGVIYARAIKAVGVKKAEDVTAKMIKSLLPGFRPAFIKINGNRVYTLMPDKISLVKSDGAGGTELNDDGTTGDDSSSTTDDSSSDSGSGSGTSSSGDDNSGVSGGDDNDTI